MEDNNRIIKTEYSELMQKSYIDYAMSVIVARALPDVRDGLKPVQRRVLYDMYELGIRYDRPYRKSARIVGDTMGKYHPHGDSSIYEALVVMAQEFKKGQPLIDGHGNFGNIEGDGAAAMRYTEARLEKLTPSLREEVLHRLEGIELGEIVLTHGDLTGENLLVKEDGSLVVIDWADARLAPAWYELGPIAFELFQGRGELLRLFAGADREAFIERLVDCCCLHDFGADFLWNFWQREGVAEFRSLEEVRELLEKKLA